MGESRRTHGRSTIRRTGQAAALLLLAAGCSTDTARDIRRDDPILGSNARTTGNQPTAVATATPSGPAPPSYAPQQPLTPATPTSNAALAGGFQPLPGGSDLRMGNGGATPVSQPGASAPQSVQPASAPVQGVTPVPPPSSAWTAPQPVPTSVNPPLQRGTLEQAYATVASRNPLWHRLKFNGQSREYTFEMSVASKLNTAMQRTVEASAPTAPEAIQRAIEQLGNE